MKEENQQCVSQILLTDDTYVARRWNVESHFSSDMVSWYDNHLFSYHSVTCNQYITSTLCDIIEEVKWYLGGPDEKSSTSECFVFSC